jgi:hypothetical protein
MDIKQEVMKSVGMAYADCWISDFYRAEKVRDLDFRAPYSLSKSDVIEVMNFWFNRYNRFVPDLLEHLPADSSITIAREGSVCMYVESKELIKFSYSELEGLREKMKADELDRIYGSKIRIWWD